MRFDWRKSSVKLQEHAFQTNSFCPLKSILIHTCAQQSIFMQENDILGPKLQVFEILSLGHSQWMFHVGLLPAKINL